MLDSGFKMDEYTLGSFVHALCKAGRWKEALALVEKEEFVTNTVLYTKMIYGFCEASLFEEAMDFLNRIRCDSCIPNVVTYRTLLCGCLKKRQLTKKVSDADQLFEMMLTEGCSPNVIAYTALIDGHCKAGRIEKACQIYERMRDGFCKYGKLDEAQEVFAKMSEQGYSPNVYTYSSLIDRRGFAGDGGDDAGEEEGFAAGDGGDDAGEEEGFAGDGGDVVVVGWVCWDWVTGFVVDEEGGYGKGGIGLLVYW
ncbi:hypothetical protein ACFX1X_032166 [Malus domestica]